MPNNGKVFEAQAVEWKCGSTGSHTGSGHGDPVYGHGAEAYTQYAPDAVNLAVGIYLSAQSDFDGTSGSWQVVYDGPGAPFGGYIVGGSSYLSDVSISAVARDVKLYCKITGSLFQLSWSAIDIYVNGSFDITLTGSGVDATSAGVGPNYIPLIGIPLTLSGGVSAGRTNVPTWDYNPCDPDEDLPIEWEAETTGGPYGGWRFQELDDSWISLPVTPYSGSDPSSSGCPYGLSSEGVLNFSETWGGDAECKSYARFKLSYAGREVCPVTVTVICQRQNPPFDTVESQYTGPGMCEDLCSGGYEDAYVDLYNTESWSESTSGLITLIPDLEKAIKKIGDDYRALWYRGTFPSATAAHSRTCTIDDVTISSSDSPVIFPSVSEFLGCVENTLHAIEDPLVVSTFAPCSVSKSKDYSKNQTGYATSICICPPSWMGDWQNSCPNDGSPWLASIGCDFGCPDPENSSESESVSFIFPSAVGSGGGYQSHAVGLARYLGTWANPHWQFFFWREDWEVDESPAPWADYWGLIREQWLFNDALPGGEQRKTRNSLILSPIENENGNTPFLDTFAGGLRWLGISRWQTDEIALPESLTLSSSRPGVWESEDCDIALGSGITCDNFTGSSVKLDLELSQWEEEPYMLLQLAKKVKVGWGSNVDSMSVLLVGHDGATTGLGSSETTYEYPQGAQTRYAGSWASDHGAGAITDTGSDVAAGGISSTTLGDSERGYAFQLGTGQTYRKLRFVFTPTDPEEPVIIDWPEFLFDDTHPLQFWENAKHQTWLWADGPAIRWGTWTFYIPDVGYQWPPVPSYLGTANTIIDWLSFRRCVIQGVEGTGGTPNLTTELTQLFDSYEGQAISVVDKFSHACPLPPKDEDATIRCALVNSFSEVPPMACFPYRERDDSWQPTGDHAQVVWDWAQEKRLLISSDTNPAKLTGDDDNSVGSAMPSPPSGWHIWEFSPELDNTESGWKIVTDAPKHWATVRPWHGWFCLLAEGVTPDGVYPWNLMSAIGQYHRTDVQEGDVWYRRATFSAPFGGFEHEGKVTESEDCSHPRMAEDGRPVLYLVYIREGVGAVIRASSDEGTTFGSEMELIPDAHFVTIANDGIGTLVVLGFIYDSGDSGPGTLRMRLRGPGDLSWSTAVTVQSGGSDLKLEPDTFHVCYDKQGPGRWVLVGKAEGDDGASEWYSTDECKTFKAV